MASRKVKGAGASVHEDASPKGVHSLNRIREQGGKLLLRGRLGRYSGTEADDDAAFSVADATAALITGTTDLDLSLMNVSAAEFLTLSYVIGTAKGLERVVLTGATMDTACCRLLLDALQKNRSPIIDVDLTGAKLSSKYKTALLKQCEDNRRLVEDRYVRTLSKNESTLPLDSADGNIPKKLIEVRLMSTREYKALVLEELKERKQIRKSWHWITRAHVLQNLYGSKLHQSVTIALQTEVQEEQAREGLEGRHFSQYANIYFQFYVCHRAFIQKEENGIRRTLWQEAVFSWAAATQVHAKRLAGFDVEQQELEVKQQHARRGLALEEWNARNELLDDAVTNWRTTQETLDSTKIVRDEERRRVRQKLMDEARERETREKKLLHERNLKEGQSIRQRALIEQGETKERYNVVDPVTGSEPLIRRLLTEVWNYARQAYDASTALNSAVTKYMSCVMEDPLLKVVVSRSAPIRTRFDDTVKSLPIEPDCEILLRMDSLWGPRVGVYRKEVQRLLPGTIDALEEAATASEKRLGDLESLLRRRKMILDSFPDYKAVLPALMKKPSIQLPDISEIKKRKETILSGYIEAELPDDVNGALHIVGHDSGKFPATDNGRTVKIEIPAGAHEDDVRNILSYLRFQSEHMELSAVKIIDVKVVARLLITDCKHFALHNHVKVPKSHHVRCETVLRVIIFPRFINPCVLCQPYKTGDLPMPVLPKAKVAPMYTVSRGRKLDVVVGNERSLRKFTVRAQLVGAVHKSDELCFLSGVTNAQHSVAVNGKRIGQAYYNDGRLGHPEQPVQTLWTTIDDASGADFQELLRSICFVNEAESPPAGERCVTFTVFNECKEEVTCLSIQLNFYTPDQPPTWNIEDLGTIYYRATCDTSIDEEFAREHGIETQSVFALPDVTVVDNDTKVFYGGGVFIALRNADEEDEFFVDKYAAEGFGIEVNSEGQLLWDGKLIGSCVQDAGLLNIRFSDEKVVLPTMDTVQMLLRCVKYRSEKWRPEIGNKMIDVTFHLGTTTHKVDVAGNPLPDAPPDTSEITAAIKLKYVDPLVTLTECRLEYTENSGNVPVVVGNIGLDEDVLDYGGGFLRVELMPDAAESEDHVEFLVQHDSGHQLVEVESGIIELADANDLEKTLHTPLEHLFCASYAAGSTQQAVRVALDRRRNLEARGLDDSYYQCDKAYDLVDRLGSHIARVFQQQQKVTLCFSSTMRVTRDDVIMALRCINFRNTSRDPHILRKPIRFRLGAKGRGQSETLVIVNINVVDDPTELHLQKPTLEYTYHTTEVEPHPRQLLKRLGGLRDRYAQGREVHESSIVEDSTIPPRLGGAMQLFPHKYTTLFDPDTEFWDGGFIEIANRTWIEHVDGLRLLTVAEQKIIHKHGNFPCYVQMGDDGVIDLLALDETVAHKHIGSATCTHSPPPPIEDENSGESPSVEHEPVTLPFVMLRIDFTKHRPSECVLDRDTTEYILNCIVFESTLIPPAELGESYTPRAEKVFDTRITDGKNPVFGTATSTIVCLPPLVSIQTTYVMMYTKALGKDGDPLLPFATCGLGDREKLMAGFIEIIALSGFNQRDSLGTKFSGTQFVVSQTDSALVVGKEAVGKLTVTPQYMRLDFSHRYRGANGRRIQQFLRCVMLKVDEFALGERQLAVISSAGRHDAFGRLETSVEHVTVNVTDVKPT